MSIAALNNATQGRSGTLPFVTVRHEISNARGLALGEEHDIVCRDAPVPASAPGAPAGSAPAPQPAPSESSFRRKIVPDPMLSFRCSALTFNGDRSHVTEVESFSGLVVHGPLIATLLVDLLRRDRRRSRVKRFAFTAVRPGFDTHRFHVCGRDDGSTTFGLWGRNHGGFLTMGAEARTE